MVQANCSFATNREAVAAQSPGLPRFAATLGVRRVCDATLSGLRPPQFLVTQRSLRQRWAEGLNRFAVDQRQSALHDRSR
jgi:hypothetical protein